MDWFLHDKDLRHERVKFGMQRRQTVRHLSQTSKTEPFEKIDNAFTKDEVFYEGFLL